MLLVFWHFLARFFRITHRELNALSIVDNRFTTSLLNLSNNINKHTLTQYWKLWNSSYFIKIIGRTFLCNGETITFDHPVF